MHSNNGVSVMVKFIVINLSGVDNGARSWHQRCGSSDFKPGDHNSGYKGQWQCPRWQELQPPWWQSQQLPLRHSGRSDHSCAGRRDYCDNAYCVQSSSETAACSTRRTIWGKCDTNHYHRSYGIRYVIEHHKLAFV